MFFKKNSSLHIFDRKSWTLTSGRSFYQQKAIYPVKFPNDLNFCHCTNSLAFITAHCVHHCTLKQALDNTKRESEKSPGRTLSDEQAGFRKDRSHRSMTQQILMLKLISDRGESSGVQRGCGRYVRRPRASTLESSKGPVFVRAGKNL